MRPPRPDEVRRPQDRGSPSAPGETRPSATRRIAAAAAALALAATALFSPSELRAQSEVDRWLVLGPVPMERPALAPPGDSVLLDASGYEFGPRWPLAGAVTGWLGRDSLTWEARGTGDGTLELDPGAAGARAAQVVTYLAADRWQEARVRAELPDGARLTLDGEPVADGETVPLRRGKHRLAVHTVRSAADTGSWSLSLSVESRTGGPAPEPTIDPTRPPDWMDLHDRTSFSDVAVAPGGGRVAVSAGRVDRRADEWTSRLQVRSLPGGEVTADLPAATGVAGATWSPDGERLAFTAPAEGEDASGSDLWIWRPDGESRRVIRAREGLSDLAWGPGGGTIYYTATARRPGEGGPDGVTRLTEVWERWPTWDDRAHLYAVDLGTGNRRKLVGDPRRSVAGATLSPDGTRIVFTRNVRRNVRPYVESEVRLLDLETGESRTLLTLDEESFGGPGGYAWSPDGRAVAFCGPLPAALEGESPEGAVAEAETEAGRRNRKASVFETELFATPVDDPGLRWLSRDFTPTVGPCGAANWSAEDGRIYVSAGDGARTVPARTAAPVRSSSPTGSLEAMDAPGHVLGSHDFSDGRLVGTFESPTTPPSLRALDLGDGTVSTLADPGLPAGDQLRMPGWEPWSYPDGDGHTIEAWYWTPPGFDPAGEYPVIVHYYGGTIAMKKGFSEQLLWYASRGYVVLMMNPGGAPGYGHEFSNEHIDDWGRPAGTDIIRGVRAFAREHDFVDEDRIGNFGGSYGGFMTMHVLARTDTLFRAAAERAGISGITGYWGAGWWGFSYTDGTCPGCYPWNRPDVFVDRSPVYRADEIREPLLILHGTADDNVPPHQSAQIFTALRALDRPAEYLKFHGEGHGIGSTPSVRRRFEASILEWFDRWLRDRPAAWRARWDGSGARGEGR